MRKAKSIIHVNMHHIRHNKKFPEDMKPVITVKKGKTNTYCNTVKINGPSEVVYRPENPLSCGARLWISTESEVETFL